MRLKFYKGKYEKVIFIFITTFTFAAFTGCSNDNEIKTTQSGLKYFDEIVGEGRDANVGDLLSIHFKGWIVMDSTNLFSDWTKDSTHLPYLIGDS